MSELPKKGSKGVVDMIFLVDATGSMAPCIEALKTNISTFVTSLVTKDANNSNPVRDWRARVIGYRDYDYESEAPAIEDNVFVNSVDEVQEQLARLVAEGGGDEPESLLEGLYHTATLPSSGKDEEARPDAWRYRTAAARVVIIFTDASFKEPLARPAGATLDDVFNQLTSNRIVLSIFAPDMPCYQRLAELDKAEWNVVEGGRDPQESLQLFTADQKNFSKVLQQLARTISKTADVPLI